MRASETSLDQIFERGRVWCRNALSEVETRELATLSALASRPGSRLSNSGPIAEYLRATDYFQTFLRCLPGYRLVRVVAFDKSGDLNWGVPWHQDRLIAVNNRYDLDGFSSWSRKGDVWHCEPPVEILHRMIFARIHLDRCDLANGAMEVALGSHKEGKVRSANANQIASSCESELAIADAGDVLLLPMLTLHRSLPSQSDMRRRVLRIDFASSQLPEPLDWAE